VFVSFHFSLCIFCFVLVLTSMHHESLVEVKKKKRDLCTATLAWARKESPRAKIEGAHWSGLARATLSRLSEK